MFECISCGFFCCSTELNIYQIRSDARKLFSSLFFPVVILVVVAVRFAAVPSAPLHGLHRQFVGQYVEAARSAVEQILVPAVAHGAALALEEDVAEAAPAVVHLVVVAVPCCGALVAAQPAVDDQLGLLGVVAPSAHPHVAQSTLLIQQTNIYKQITETVLTATRGVCFVTIPFTIRFVELQLCLESEVTTTKITQNQFRDLPFWKEHHNKINLLLGSGVGGAGREDLYGTFLGLQEEEDLLSSILII